MSLTQALLEFDREVEKAQSDLYGARQVAEDEFLEVAEAANEKLQAKCDEVDATAAAYNLAALAYDAERFAYQETKREAAQAHRQAEKDAMAIYDEAIAAARSVYRARLATL